MGHFNILKRVCVNLWEKPSLVEVVKERQCVRHEKDAVARCVSTGLQNVLRN